MYRLVVEEISGARERLWKKDVGHSASGRNGRTLAAADCRISALSSADYCLRDRVEVSWNRIAWKGNRQEICRLFEAERLSRKGLEGLDGQKDYTVLFLNLCRGCA